MNRAVAAARVVDEDDKSRVETRRFPSTASYWVSKSLY